jgi:hypothetical protein
MERQEPLLVVIEPRNDRQRVWWFRAAITTKNSEEFLRTERGAANFDVRLAGHGAIIEQAVNIAFEHPCFFSIEVEQNDLIVKKPPFVYSWLEVQQVFNDVLIESFDQQLLFRMADRSWLRFWMRQKGRIIRLGPAKPHQAVAAQQSRPTPTGKPLQDIHEVLDGIDYF